MSSVYGVIILRSGLLHGGGWLGNCLSSKKTRRQQTLDGSAPQVLRLIGLRGVGGADTDEAAVAGPPQPLGDVGAVEGHVGVVEVLVQDADVGFRTVQSTGTLQHPQTLEWRHHRGRLQCIR